MLPRATPSEIAAYRKTIVESHTLRPIVEILDMSWRTLRSLRPVVLDGQVTVDTDADAERVLTMDLLDASHALRFDTESPDEGALTLDRLLRVAVEIGGPRLDEPVRVPVFTGVPVKPERKGPVLSIEAQSLDVLGLSPAWRPRTWPKGTKKHVIIREILGPDYMGLRHHVPARASRIPKDLTLNRGDLPLLLARRLATAMGCQILIRADGYAVMRPIPDRTTWTFYGDRDGGSVLETPTATPDLTAITNAVSVVGACPEGAKSAVTSRRVAEHSDPLAPHRLGPGGSERFLPTLIEDGDIRCQEDADALRDRTLREGLLIQQAVEATVLPVYHLEPLDLVALHTDDFQTDFRLKRFALPLAATGGMTVGYTRKIRPNRKAIRS